MAPIAGEAAWPEDAGLVAWGGAARFRRVPFGTRAGPVPPTGREVAVVHDDPAGRGGKVPTRPTILAQEARAFHGATPCAPAEPCATGIDAIPGFARLACVPPIALPAIQLDPVGSSCAVIAAGVVSDAAIALFRTA